MEKIAISGKVKIVTLGNAAIHAAVTLWKEAGLLRPWNNPWEDARKAIVGLSSVILVVLETDILLLLRWWEVMVIEDGSTTWRYPKTFAGAELVA